MPRFQDLPLERQLTAIVVDTTMAGMLLASVAIVAYQILTFTTFMIAELETTAGAARARAHRRALRCQRPTAAVAARKTRRARQRHWPTRRVRLSQIQVPRPATAQHPVAPTTDRDRAGQRSGNRVRYHFSGAFRANGRPDLTSGR